MIVSYLSKLPSDILNLDKGAADYIVPLTIEKNSAAILADKDNFILRLAY
jgi:hypothetical protein